MCSDAMKSESRIQWAKTKTRRPQILVCGARYKGIANIQHVRVKILKKIPLKRIHQIIPGPDSSKMPQTMKSVNVNTSMA